MTDKKDFEDEIAEINKSAGMDDWNHPRVRMYIAAKMMMYRESNRNMERSLIFERAVNARSTDFAKAVIAEALQQVKR